MTLLPDLGKIRCRAFIRAQNEETRGMPMEQENQQLKIYGMEYFTEREFNELKRLQTVCFDRDRTNLKLELDYKLFFYHSSKDNAREHTKILLGQSSGQEAGKGPEQDNPPGACPLNEFIYYAGDMPVSYLGVSCFGGNIAEINGMTHPDWRGKGFFHQLFAHVIRECRQRHYSKVLLLSDDNSESGVAFIKSVGGIYDFSEYRMKLTRYPDYDGISPITLRTAGKTEGKTIAVLNAIFFEGEKDNPEENDNETEGYNDISPSTSVYFIELSGNIIGKIHTECNDGTAFISGFGIRPEFRKNGYGRAALNETLKILASKNISEVSLDVVCTNSKALNLYISCGFEQQSTMNYYRYPVEDTVVE